MFAQDTKTSSIKDEAPSSSKPTPKASASSKSANVSPVTEDEIRTVLLAVAPVTTQDLVSRFKSRLRGPEVGFFSITVTTFKAVASFFTNY